MTEEQKLLIKKLRYEGIGYKAIGLQQTVRETNISKCHWKTEAVLL